ncbi:MAG: hypothetical protein RR531_05670 [Longicatena sp.]
MFMRPATKEDVQSWKEIFEQYHRLITPSRKSAREMIAYLQEKYGCISFENEEWQQAIQKEVLMNEHNLEKVQPNTPMCVQLYQLEDNASSHHVFEQRAEVFKESEIFVGVEMNSGYLHIEGSDVLYDELFVYQGLDEQDIKNPFLVAQYVELCHKFAVEIV